jgi:outer membrane protein
VKNLSLILNGVLIIAVGFLYFLFFNQKSKSNNGSIEGDSTQNINIAGPAAPLPKGDQKIVYINLDTLQSQYEYIKKLNKDLENKAMGDDARLQAEGNKFQADYIRFQEQIQAQSITEQQAQEAQVDLQRKKLKLEEMEQKVSREYAQEAKKATDKYIDNVNDFLKRRSKEHHYSYVLGYIKGSQVVFANDSLDITRQVVDGLNKEYKLKSKK